ncbi:MAG: calcium-binding protein [Aestuariivirga sp.]
MTIRFWGTESQVNTTATNGQTTPVTAALTSGGYVAAWVDDAGASSSVIRFQRFDAFGNKLGAEGTLPIPAGQLDQSEPSIAGLTDGGFVIACTAATASGSLANYARFNVAGAMTTAPTVVQGGIFDIGSPKVIATSNGFEISFTRTFGPSDHDTTLFKSDLAGASTIVALEAGVMPDSPVQAITQQFSSGLGLVAYVDEQNILGAPSDPRILARVYAQVETAAGFQAPVLIDSFIDPSYLAGTMPKLDIAMAGSNIAIAETRFWDGMGIGTSITRSVYRLVDQSGTLLASGNISSDKFDVTGFVNGTFAIVAEKESQVFGATDREIEITIYNASGIAIGSEIVSSNGGLNNTSPSLTMLNDGRYVVTWQDDSGLDGSGSGIVQQILDVREGFVNGTNNAGIAETLIGNDALGDQMRGFAGNDTMYGLNGSDIIFGGDGNDVLNGGREDDTLYGDTGSDILDGGKGDDNLFGGRDNDTLAGGNGDDDLFGEDGNDTLRGGQGGDLLDGGAGTADLADYLTVTSGGVTAALDSTLAGTGEALGDTFAGVERLRGTNFDDTLRGDGLANILFGQTGADTMDGRAGADRLIGGLGIDTLTGGTQADRFEFAALTEIGDIITDFTAVDDTIVVTGAAFGGGLVAGTLGATLFQSSATNVAVNAAVRFIFENDVKILWFDADGNGAGAAVMVADLQAAATMTNADILIA